MLVLGNSTERCTMTTQSPELNEEIRRSIISLKNTLQGGAHLANTGKYLRTLTKEALQRYQSIHAFDKQAAQPIELDYLGRNGVRLLSDHGWRLTDPKDHTNPQYWLTVKAKVLVASYDEHPPRQVLIDEVKQDTEEFERISDLLRDFLHDELQMQVLSDLL